MAASRIGPHESSRQIEAYDWVARIENPRRLTPRAFRYWLWFRGSSCDPRAERSAREW